MAYVVSAKWRTKEVKEDRLLEVIRAMTAPSRAFYETIDDHAGGLRG